jgi:hypothetical protein
MSSEQYSDTPMPDLKPCPHCGEMMPAAVPMCSRCVEKHAIQEGLPIPHESRNLPPETTAPPFAWPFLGVLVIPIGIIAAYYAPGTLVILAVVVTPPLIRTILAGLRRKPDASVSMTQGLSEIFFGSLGVMFVVGMASAVAFFPACFAAGWGCFAVSDSLMGGVGPEAFVFGVVVGGMAGLIVGTWLFRRLWR